MIPEHEVDVFDKGNGVSFAELGKHHPHLRYLKPTTLVVHADGLDNLLGELNKKMPKPKKAGSSDEFDWGFHHFASYREAMQIFRNTPEQVVKFDPGELRIKDNNEAGTMVEYDVVGDFIDMGRYMEGIPESVGTMHAGNARNRRVNLMINLNQWARIQEEDIRHRGERILRLIDALEAGGIRTQLIAIDSNECAHTEIIIKRHEEPLTISDLAVVTHPDFKRRIIFRIDEYSKTWEYGYGSPYIFADSITPELLDSGNNDEMDIMIGSNLIGKPNIDSLFDKLERLLVWEMSKPVPEVNSVKMDNKGIYFNPNGSRSESDIRREGLEAIHG